MNGCLSRSRSCRIKESSGSFDPEAVDTADSKCLVCAFTALVTKLSQSLSRLGKAGGAADHAGSCRVQKSHRQDPIGLS